MGPVVGGVGKAHSVVPFGAASPKPGLRFRYNDTLRFDRFWSKDDTVINTDSSGLRAIFMVNDRTTERIKLTINEPIDGRQKSQIQEFLDYHRGPGVQHVAFHTDNICESIVRLKDRGWTGFGGGRSTLR